MAELKTSELVEPGLLEAPLMLSKNIEKLILTLGKYKDVANNITKATENETKSLIKLAEENKKLTDMSKDFIKTQKAIVDETQKVTKAAKERTVAVDDGTKKTVRQTSALSELRKELNNTKGELITLARTTGTQSKEFLAAAEKAGKLKDEINDMNDAIKNTSASPFENMATQLGNVGSKLLSLDFEGAKNASIQFANTSKQITFKGALTGLKDVGTTLLNVGKAILTNPLFLLTALFVGIGVAIYKLRDSVKPLKIAFDFVGDAMGKVTQAGKDFLDWLGLSTFALDEANKATSDFASSEIERLTKMYDEKIKLAEADGKDTTELEKKKWLAIGDAAIIGLRATLDDQFKIKEGEGDKHKALSEAQENAELQILLIGLNAKRKAREDDLKLRIKRENDYQKILLRQIKENVDKDLDLDKLLKDEKTKAEIKDSSDKVGRMKVDLSNLSNVIMSQAQIDKEFKNGLREENLTAIKEDAEKALEITEAFTMSVGAITGALTERKLQRYKEEEDALTAQYKRDLENAGGNAKEKERIERRYSQQKTLIDQKVAKEKERMAKFDKATALLQASLKTTILIIEALLNPALYAIPAIIAGAETAAIAIKPIPKYEKGTSHSIGGQAIINERGPELLQEPDGKMKMYDSEGAMLTTLKSGTKVFTAEQTQKIVGAGLRGVNANRYERQPEKSNEMLSQIIGLRKDIKNKKEIHFSINREGAELMISKAETRTKFLDTFYA